MLNKIFSIKTNKFTNNTLIGNYNSQFKGNGLDFHGFKEYDLSSDSNKIDWLVSKRENKLVIREYIEEKNIDCHFLIDYSSKFLFKNKLDILSKFCFNIGLLILNSGDKLGFINNNVKPNNKKHNLFNFINGLQKYKIIKGFSLDDELNKLSKKNSSIFFILTDNIEPNFSMINMLSNKNTIIYVNIFDSFENSLDGKGIFSVGSFFNNLFINLSDKEKKDKYVKLREKKIAICKNEHEKKGNFYLYLDEKTDIFTEFIKIMKK